MRQRRLKAEINVVPYIDVMLVLLVIFMVATPMMTTGSVDLPTTGSSSGKPPKFIRVEIETDGGLTIFDVDGNKTIVKDRKELGEKLLPMKGDSEKPTPLMIAGDRETQYRNIIDVLDEVKRLGFEKVGLETGKK